jgi:hypothetical protein
MSSSRRVGSVSARTSFAHCSNGEASAPGRACAASAAWFDFKRAPRRVTRRRSPFRPSQRPLGGGRSARTSAGHGSPGVRPVPRRRTRRAPGVPGGTSRTRRLGVRNKTSSRSPRQLAEVARAVRPPGSLDPRRHRRESPVGVGVLRRAPEVLRSSDLVRLGVGSKVESEVIPLKREAWAHLKPLWPSPRCRSPTPNGLRGRVVSGPRERMRRSVGCVIR